MMDKRRIIWKVEVAGNCDYQPSACETRVLEAEVKALIDAGAPLGSIQVSVYEYTVAPDGVWKL